jgi:hypothetical protein
MSKTLLEDNSNGTRPNWDLGTGTDDNGRVQSQAPIERVAATEQAASEAKTVAGTISDSPAPVASPWRHTSTPQPAATHGGCEDAAGLLPGATARPTASKFGSNIPDVWEYDSEPFPDDLNKCYAIVRTLDNYQVFNRAQSKEWLRRRGLIGKHIQKISNGPKPIEMTADIIAGMQKAQHERPAAMNARLAELQAYLASPISAEPIELDLDAEASDPDSRQKLAMTPKTRLVLHPTVELAVIIAKRMACAAEAFALENFDLMNPVEHVQLLERELRTSHDPARIRELQTKISKAKETGSNRSAELSIKGIAADKWNPVFDALRYAILASQLLVGSWEMDALLVEDQWFGEFGIERHSTFLSKQFTELRAELGKLNVSKTTFAWFGVNDIAESDE